MIDIPHILKPPAPYEYYTPDFYTAHEGGVWKPWPKDYRITKFVLDDELNLGVSGVLAKSFCDKGLKSIIYHSVCWRNSKGIIIGRWDCKNGWTKRLEI